MDRGIREPRFNSPPDKPPTGQLEGLVTSQCWLGATSILEVMEMFEELQKILTELQEDQRPKLVEGKKDKKALLNHGVTNIFELHELEHVLEFESVIVLVDSDPEGDKHASRLNFYLLNEGVFPDFYYRNELKKFGIYRIEELTTIYQKLKEGDVRGKNIHRHGKIRHKGTSSREWSRRETGRDRCYIRANRGSTRGRAGS